jgi:hypothetical protein
LKVALCLGLLLTLRWREMDSNFRSLSQRSGGFGLSSRGIR